MLVECWREFQRACCVRGGIDNAEGGQQCRVAADSRHLERLRLSAACGNAVQRDCLFRGVLVNTDVGGLIQSGDVVHGCHVDDERGRSDSVISRGTKIPVQTTVFDSDRDGGLTAEVSGGCVDHGLWGPEGHNRQWNQSGVAAAGRDSQWLSFRTPGGDTGKCDRLFRGILENELISHRINGGHIVHGVDGHCKRAGDLQIIARSGQVIVRTSVFNSDGNGRGAAEIGGRYKAQSSRGVG